MMGMTKIIVLGIILLLFVGLCGCISSDSDNDGVVDSEDSFPEDPAEWNDIDGDGVGDNGDKFPNDPAASVDEDNDGYPSSWNYGIDINESSTSLTLDAFPLDNTEWIDTDADGVGDNSDAFPSNSTEWKDTDLDGVGDNSDALPEDATQTEDRDGDGYGDNLNGTNPDLFPDDDSEWFDTDLDGVGDNRDLFDEGNGGIRVTITNYTIDGDDDIDRGSIDGVADSRLTMTVYIRPENYLDMEELGYVRSDICYECLSIEENITFVADIDDRSPHFILIVISARDKDTLLASDTNSDNEWESIDIHSDQNQSGIWQLIYRESGGLDMYKEYSEDGSLDGLDEMDGKIDFIFEVIEI